MIRTTCYGLTRVATVSSCHVVRGHEASSRAASQRSRIIIAVGLAVGLRRPSRILCIDREVCACVSDVVIREDARGAQRGGDVIRAPRHRFPCRAAVSRRHVVPSQEATSITRGQRIRIIIPIGLAVGVRRPGRTLCINGEVGACISDLVVA